MTKERLPLLFLSLMALLYFSDGLNSWKYSFIGDEGAFYGLAADIAKKNLIVNPLSMNGVYGEHPVLGSLYQAIFLRLFGINNFVWRFSDAFLIVPITLFYYFWLKEIFNCRIAFFSTILLGSSFYLANFFKIGYLNPICFTVFIICLYLATIAFKKRELKYYILLMIVLGLLFYLYIGRILLFVFLPFFLYWCKKERRITLKWSIISICIYTLIVLPGLTDVNNWKQIAYKSVLRKEFSDNSQIINNILVNFVLFYNNPQRSHFVYGPYLDRLTGALSLVGIFLLLFRIRKELPLRVFSLNYFCLAFILGLTSPYPTPSITRGFFLLPFGYALAGNTLDFIYQKFRFNKIIISAIVITIWVLNIYWGQIGVFKRLGYSETALVFKELQQADKENKRVVLYFAGKDLNAYNLLDMIHSYQLHNVTFSTIKEPELTSCESFSNSLVLILSRDQLARRNLLEKQNCRREGVKVKEVNNFSTLEL